MVIGNNGNICTLRGIYRARHVRRSRRASQLGRVGPEDPGSSIRVLAELDIINAYERVRSYYLNIAEVVAGGKR